MKRGRALAGVGQLTCCKCVDFGLTNDEFFELLHEVDARREVSLVGGVHGWSWLIDVAIAKKVVLLLCSSSGGNLWSVERCCLPWQSHSSSPSHFVSPSPLAQYELRCQPVITTVLRRELVNILSLRRIAVRAVRSHWYSHSLHIMLTRVCIEVCILCRITESNTSTFLKVSDYLRTST